MGSFFCISWVIRSGVVEMVRNLQTQAAISETQVTSDPVSSGGKVMVPKGFPNTQHYNVGTLKTSQFKSHIFPNPGMKSVLKYNFPLLNSLPTPRNPPEQLRTIKRNLVWPKIQREKKSVRTRRGPGVGKDYGKNEV